MRCSKCNSGVGHCPDCEKEFEHGTADHCDNPICVEMNAPIDCVCGFVVCKGALGVLDFNMNFLPFKS